MIGASTFTVPGVPLNRAESPEVHGKTCVPLYHSLVVRSQFPEPLEFTPVGDHVTVAACACPNVTSAANGSSSTAPQPALVCDFLPLDLANSDTTT
ncbi:hypothetical protein DP49_5703 [Burkholderia pseudomallei]|nr:hypothetical protein DP49_5703 [Burkholderia pseudomallei]